MEDDFQVTEDVEPEAVPAEGGAAEVDADAEEGVNLIDPKATEGVWFHFKGKARLKIRRVTSLRRRSLVKANLGKRVDERPLFEQSIKLRVKIAAEALLDSENVFIPAEYLTGTELAGGTGNVRLDGRWSDPVRRVVLAEVVPLLAFVLAKVDELAAQPDEDEASKD